MCFAVFLRLADCVSSALAPLRASLLISEPVAPAVPFASLLRALCPSLSARAMSGSVMPAPSSTLPGQSSPLALSERAMLSTHSVYFALQILSLTWLLTCVVSSRHR